MQGIMGDKNKVNESEITDVSEVNEATANVMV